MPADISYLAGVFCIGAVTGANDFGSNFSGNFNAKAGAKVKGLNISYAKINEFMSAGIVRQLNINLLQDLSQYHFLQCYQNEQA